MVAERENIGWQLRAHDFRLYFQVSIVILTFLILFIFNFQNFYANNKIILDTLIVLFSLSAIISIFTFTAITDSFFGQFPERYLRSMSILSNTSFSTAILILLMTFPFGNVYAVYFGFFALASFTFFAVFFYKYKIIFSVQRKQK
jgi:uncharacterized integral membrane protein